MLSRIKKITKELWWAVVGAGIVSIIFGLVAMLWPHITLQVFIYLFSFFVLAVSVIILGQAFVNMRVDPLWWLSMLFSICGISISLFIMTNPTVAQGIIAVLLAVYIFVQSLMDLIVASYSEDSETKTPMTIVGIVGIIFGFLVLFMPSLATEAMVWVIGLYILAHGLFTEYYAIKTRSEVSRTVKNVKKTIKSIADEVDDVVVEAEVVDEPKKSKKARKTTSKKASTKSQSK